MAVEAHILRRVYTTIRIKEMETDELTTTLVIAFHQTASRRPSARASGCATTSASLSPNAVCRTTGRDKVTTEELFGRVDEWLSNFEVQMNEDRNASAA